MNEHVWIYWLSPNPSCLPVFLEADSPGWSYEYVQDKALSKRAKYVKYIIS